MANDPKSRLTEGNLNSPPYTAPNGITEQRGTASGTASGIGGSEEVGRRDDETAGEKIGRFFRRAMERLSGRDDDWEERRDEVRDERNRDQLSDRTGGWQPGRSGRYDRTQGEWSDLGRSRDERNPSYRSGPAGDTGGAYERYRSGSGYGQGQGSYGEPSSHGEGSSYGQGSYAGQSSDEADPTRFAGTGRGAYGPRSGSSGQGSYGQLGPSFESRGTQGQRGPGRSPGESYTERGFQGEPGRDDWSRGDWNRQERWGERSRQSGATGMSASYAGAGGSFGFGRDEQRAGDWGETARDRDRGQGRRFWQREPLAARDVMTRNPKTVSRQSPIREAALIMREENCGVVPVVDEAGRLQGILTDRDIVVRGVVDDATLRRMEEVMTDDVSAVTEDEPLTSVLDLMGRKQIRRVPVVDRNDRLLGIISMADIANRADYDEDLQDAFERISSRRSFWSLFS
ncbi:MAG TPA: CBS domain-containing protein [Myxococcaceae bacterium]|nr:CBS domain-containing protein [Myxococcaceae bacterium]